MRVFYFRLASNVQDARTVLAMHGLDRQHRTSEMACASWLLTGMTVSVNQHELPDWRRLHKMVSDTVKMLPMIKPTMH